MRLVGNVAPAFWRIPVLLLAVITVAGCAGPDRTGKTIDAVTRSVGGPKPGNARIVVLRNKEFAGIIDAGWQVKLDGAPMGDLKTGTFVYRDRPAGNRQLTFARPGDLNRGSKHDFVVSAGRIYYFRLELNDKGKLVAAGGGQGLLPLLVTSAIAEAKDERGLFDFVPLDDATARQALGEIRLAD
jgi:hypothetical protein